MRHSAVTILVVFLIQMSGFAGEPNSDYAHNWPQWRGPLATGVAPHANPPVQWSESENVRWKVEVPGTGHASPVIWDTHVYVQTAIETEQTVDEKTIAEVRENQPRWMRNRGVAPTSIQQFVILALNRQDGTIAWKKILREEYPHEGTHRDATWASNSPVTDGEGIIAYFGSRGLYCLDMQGNVLWEKDLGDMRTRNGFGEGSSPALYDDVVVVNWDHEGDSFIVALDRTSGAELWKKERDEVTSWSTPIIVEVEGEPQVIVNATGHTRGYDLQTGQVIWQAQGMTVNTISSPVYDNGLVYVMSGFRGSMLQAIRLADASGELDDSASMVWTHDRDTPYVPSPLLYDNYLYFLKVNSGILSCFNARTGEPYYGPERLDDIKNIYASPVGAADRVYLTGREGTTMVLEKGPELRVLASNSLDDRFDASAAIVGNELYLRGHRFMYCLAEK